MEVGDTGTNARRKCLQLVIASLCNEAGFDSADNAALETLTEMMQSFLSEAGRSSRAYCELACRSEPTMFDVQIALSEMGFAWTGFEAYVRRPQRSSVPMPAQSAPSKQPTILQTGDRKPHASHIPDHLPPFPDSHSYIRTPTHKKPVTEYEAIREKSSTQKRDVERALTRFVAKTGETQSLFQTDDSNVLPLIACKVTPSPYLSALLPKDQLFEEEETETWSKMKKKQQQREEEEEAEGEYAAADEGGGEMGGKSDGGAQTGADDGLKKTKKQSKNAANDDDSAAEDGDLTVGGVSGLFTDGLNLSEDIGGEVTLPLLDENNADGGGGGSGGGRRANDGEVVKQQSSSSLLPSRNQSSSTTTTETDAIDNPYLRPIKMPTLKKR